MIIRKACRPSYTAAYDLARWHYAELREHGTSQCADWAGNAESMLSVGTSTPTICGYFNPRASDSERLSSKADEHELGLADVGVLQE